MKKKGRRSKEHKVGRGGGEVGTAREDRTIELKSENEIYKKEIGFTRRCFTHDIQTDMSIKRVEEPVESFKRFEVAPLGIKGSGGRGVATFVSPRILCTILITSFTLKY